MFVQQGARQFEIWTGKPAPEEEMLRVVIHALRQQAEAAAAPEKGNAEANAGKQNEGVARSAKSASAPAKRKKAS